MHADTPGRRRALRNVAWIVVGVAVLWGVYVWITPESEPYTHLRKVSVAGYEKVAEEGSVSAAPSASAVFVGPPVDDVSRIISAPGLTVTLLPPSPPNPPPSDPLPGERNYIWTQIAAGRWANGCALAIIRELETPYHEDKLTTAQIAGVKAGSVYLIRITATCGTW
ncbi:hypothetical protein [Nocardia gipuzkoensis]|uniref:hypothetical protein n=1 Tax=Nocardia gipuzkoensis TaxID=2749991 RepID=UPI003EDF50DB